MARAREVTRNSGEDPMERKHPTGKRRKDTYDPSSLDARTAKVLNAPTMEEQQVSAHRQNDASALSLNEFPNVPPVVDRAERRTAPSVNVLDPTKSSGVEYKYPSQAMGQ